MNGQREDSRSDVQSAGAHIGTENAVAQYTDYRTISDLLMSGECPPEAFVLLAGWASGKPVRTKSNAANSAAVKALRAAPQLEHLSLPMRDDIRLTVGGVVMIPGVGWMHPESFKEIAGEDAFAELLRRPRVVCEYD